MDETKRKGDKVKIAGSYQYDAIHRGNVFQRNWHKLKLQAAAGLANIGTSSTIIDLGCGSGILTAFLPTNFRTYTGLDANEDAIDFANNTYSNTKISFRLFQLDDLRELDTETFSTVFFLETIEHITGQQGLDTLIQLHRLMEKGGRCIITTPNRRSLWPMIEWLLDFLRLTPRLKDEQHEKLYSRNELAAIAIAAGFSIHSMKTVNGLAPWLSFLGPRITWSIHRWEMANDWLPGSLIVLSLEKTA